MLVQHLKGTTQVIVVQGLLGDVHVRGAGAAACGQRQGFSLATQLNFVGLSTPASRR